MRTAHRVDEDSVEEDESDARNDVDEDDAEPIVDVEIESEVFCNERFVD